MSATASARHQGRRPCAEVQAVGLRLTSNQSAQIWERCRHDRCPSSDRCVVTRSQPLTGLQGVGVGEHLMQSMLQESAFAGGVDQGQRFAISGRGFLPTAGAAE